MGYFKDYYDEDEDDSDDYELNEAGSDIREFYVEFSEACDVIVSDFSDIKKRTVYNPAEMKQAFVNAIKDLKQIDDSYSEQVGDDQMLPIETYLPLKTLILDLDSYFDGVKNDRKPEDFASQEDRVAFCDGVVNAVRRALSNMKDAYDDNGLGELI